MRFLDLFPLKGAFLPGEMVQILVRVETGEDFQGRLELDIRHFAKRIDRLSRSISGMGQPQSLVLDWQAPSQSPAGYSIEARLVSASGEELDRVLSAVDILPAWTDNPRYGYLCDFFPDRGDVEATIQSLLPFHINGLQFYDWQYRHDQLLPPKIDFEDPLGRPLSLDTVRTFLEAAHHHGMAALPYLAVYAASLDFWRKRPDWALYDAQGKALTFLDFLGLMDPSPGGSWQKHLLAECTRVAATLPFDGFHVDQYGDPKEAFDVRGERVDLPNSFVEFVSSLKEHHPEAAVIFNAVGNWPIEALADSPQDFLYIEVWPPATSYMDLVDTVSEARRLSHGKPVVIALYLPADRPANVLIADALITSCGGSRIEFGETASLLVDPYFPKYQPISSELKSALRRYADFAVAYGELLGPAGGECQGAIEKLPANIWAACRTCPGWMAISLVNLPARESSRWDVDHGAPRPLLNLSIEASVPFPIRNVWWASPDRGDRLMIPVLYQSDRDKITATIPYLDIWGVLFLEIDGNKAN